MATDQRIANAEVNMAALQFSAATAPAQAQAMILSGPVEGQAHEVRGVAELARTPLRDMSRSEQQQLLVPRLALQRAKLWNREEGVTISYLERPDSALRRAIDDAIDDWASHIDMRLRVVSSSTANIRIGFRYRGFFSLVGTDSANMQLAQQFRGQSLNIQPGLSGQDYFSVALHELGHALGAVHEHQSPSGNIPWDREAVYRYYGGPPNNWSRQQVDFQVFQKYGRDVVNASRFDDDSIMLYPVPEDLLDRRVSGYRSFITGWNRALSNCDQAFIQDNYGVGASGRRSCNGSNADDDPADIDGEDDVVADETRSRRAKVTLLKLDTRMRARLSDDGETHVYRIEVASDGDYVIETVEENPAVAVTLSLSRSSSTPELMWYSLNSRRHILNAYVKREGLARGTYYVHARHRNRRGRGSYVILFRKKMT